MVFDRIDKIIENVLREQLIVEGTNQKKLRARAVRALIDRGVDAEEAKSKEEKFFNAHFHGAHDRLVRLEAFFISAVYEVRSDEDKVNRLIEILDLIKRNWQKDGFYDIGQLKAENPSNYKYDTLNNLFGGMVDEEKRNDEALANSQDGTSIADGYSVKNVTSFKEAKTIGDYSCPKSKLCFTQRESTWRDYLSDGANECYVILRDGWKEMNPNDYLDDPNRPYDEYGLSMIFLFIKPNGKIATSNTRWNHETGGKYQGDVDQSFSKGDIAKLLGVNFDEVFKPSKMFGEKVKTAMQRIANGEDLVDVFDECGRFKDGFVKVKLCGKWNFINENGELLSPKKWFDYCSNFFDGFARVELDGKKNYINTNGVYFSGQWFDEFGNFVNGLAHVKLNGKENFLKPNGDLISDKWFDSCYAFKDGLSKVELNGKFNFIKPNGKPLSDQWFDDCGFFNDGFTRVKLDGKWNLINENGDIAFPDKWFDYCGNFFDGFAVVRLDGEFNFINVNGEYFSDQWFDKCTNFVDGFAIVYLDGKINCLTQNREYLSDQWLDDIFPFRSGFAIVYLDGKKNLLKRNGGLVSPKQWFDDCSYFVDGFAEVKLDGKLFYIDTNGRFYDERPQVTESRMMTKIISESIRMTLRQLI